jgi:TPR repeat protein
MVGYICKMFRFLLYLLPVFLLYQVICANEGTRWIRSDLGSLIEAADSGDAYAQGFLALCHYHGDKGLKVSHLESRFYAENSASRGHWLGDFVLGNLARYKPIGPDPKMVAKYLLKSFRDPDGILIKQAAAGDPVASYVLAEIFISDEIQTILNPDMKMAAQYYEISAEAGYAPACVQSALIKIHGLANSLTNESEEVKKGVSLLQKGIDQKLPSAHHYLGECFLEGRGVNLDKELALVHFQAAADRGYGAALLRVADFYAYGVVGDRKEDMAMEYVQKAVDIHYSGAEQKLMELQNLFNPQTDSGEDPAGNTLQSSGDTEAVPPTPLVVPEKLPPTPPRTLRLPSAYSKELDNEQKMQEAEQVKEEANLDISIPPPSISPNPKNQVSAEGISISQRRESAKKIYWGRSSTLLLKEAVSDFEFCANQGDAESARYLGIMYLRGKGVNKDAQQALKWLELAANGGDELAKKNLQSLRKIVK